MCPPTRRRQCFNSDLLILILLCICFVSQLNWRKQFGRGLTATRSAGRRERPPSLSPNVSIKAWRRPPLPCSRTTPNTTEVRKENKPLTQVNNQVRQVREVREEIQETRCLTLKLSSTCRNPMQSLLWLVSSHRPEEAPPTMFPHQLCPAGGVAERVTVSLWHHGVTDVLTARLSYDTSSVFWFFHSIYDARIIKKKNISSVLLVLCVTQSLSQWCRGVSIWFLRRGPPQIPAWSIPPPWPTSATTSSSATNVWPCCWEPGTNTHRQRTKHSVAWLHFTTRHLSEGGMMEVHIRVGVLNYLVN